MVMDYDCRNDDGIADDGSKCWWYGWWLYEWQWYRQWWYGLRDWRMMVWMMMVHMKMVDDVDSVEGNDRTKENGMDPFWDICGVRPIKGLIFWTFSKDNWSDQSSRDGIGYFRDNWYPLLGGSERFFEKFYRDRWNQKQSRTNQHMDGHTVISKTT